jgi:anti-sigma regulatory factor (Ser/Thr protein kinase)
VGLEADVCDATALLTSEIVSNAVIHGRSDIRLVVTGAPHGMRIEVGDDNHCHPVPKAADPEDLDGRGLVLLEAISTCWGVDDDQRGKIVWFEVHVGCKAASRP